MTSVIVPGKDPSALVGLAAKPPAVFLPHEGAAERFFGFFTANHQNRSGVAAGDSTSLLSFAHRAF